ncbi:DUF2750 domain-containing protein [Methylomonas sp. MED-D]|uniref:DUF2750 domain-containing protein n=1 Tax=Methylomonas koyamae TaxID=702114 RepID=A0A177NY99_9GAMM|nr:MULTISPECIES: DUF2750 domain-containing protein [Methylomonas]OAI22040.1 hypothetical protein A1355_22790 [Methylomonas koyamae]OHX35979.1 hypothetical protein BJL95_02765 [Methylomonas sp. LWB]WGS87377.1 DUF2750 domain-containing protein [Methylomonas sp. UP202]
MRYDPHPEEIAAVPDMSDEERLEYFLYRIFETDEVWGLKEGPQPLIRELDGRNTLPVWPYKRYAADAVAGEWAHLAPGVESVDFFTYQTLNKLAREEVTVEIMPRPGAAGCLITPQRLFGMLENMMESRDYTVGD